MTSSLQSLKEQLEELARDTFGRLRESRALEIRFGEETITDLILLEMKRSKRPNTRIVQTFQHEEKIQGTDWKWWIGSNRIGWIRYAVQAKRVDKNTGRYNSLTHAVAGTLQSDLLRDYARGEGAVSVYCFYNYPLLSVPVKHWHCCDRSYEGRAGNAIRLDLARIGRNFEIARKEWEWPLSNPVRDVRKPRVPRGRYRRLERDEEKRLLQACRPPFQAVIHWALATAMRREEIANLR